MWMNILEEHGGNEDVVSETNVVNSYKKAWKRWMNRDNYMQLQYKKNGKYCFLVILIVNLAKSHLAKVDR